MQFVLRCTLVLMLCGPAAALASYSIATAKHPDAAAGFSFGTYLLGTNGEQSVGYFRDESFLNHGFIFDGQQYTTVDYPGDAVGSTTLYDIDGETSVGTFSTDAGMSYTSFTYDGTEFVDFVHPDVISGDTTLFGIEGGTLSGGFRQEGGAWHGFVYDGETYQNLTHPNASSGIGQGTLVFATDGTNAAGSYVDASQKWHGFVFDGSTFTDISPADANDIGTFVYGIEGELVAGNYYRELQSGFSEVVSFVFDGESMEEFSIAGADEVYLQRIEDGRLVGHARGEGALRLDLSRAS